MAVPIIRQLQTWAVPKPGQTVIEVEERLREKREIAHTTVLNTMDRLYRKGSPDTLR